MIKKTSIKTAMTIVTTLSLILIAGFAGCAKQERKASGEIGKIPVENAEEQRQGEEQVSEQVETQAEAQDEEPVLENEGTFDINLAVGAFDGVIRAKVENGEVVGEIVKEVRVTFSEGSAVFTTSSEYVDGGFTLTLPETIDEKLLESVKRYHPYTYKISDWNANDLRFDRIQGYDSNGSHVGDFRLHDPDSVKLVELEEDGLEYFIQYLYVDRDVAIQISEETGWCENLSLKKGWNKAYAESWLPSGNGCLTTAPQACNLKWRFIKNDSN
jgi:hypothetical protein